jgi:hypothetical protein
MGLSRRYEPEHPAGEKCGFGMDFSPLLAPGSGIVSGSLRIFTNTAVPANAANDWTMGPVTVLGPAVYAVLAGGVSGQDYQLVWTATDSDGNVWPRTALVLCAPTS